MLYIFILGLFSPKRCWRSVLKASEFFIPFLKVIMTSLFAISFSFGCLKVGKFLMTLVFTPRLPFWLEILGLVISVLSFWLGISGCLVSALLPFWLGISGLSTSSLLSFWLETSALSVALLFLFWLGISGCSVSPLLLFWLVASGLVTSLLFPLSLTGSLSRSDSTSYCVFFPSSFSFVRVSSK